MEEWKEYRLGDISTMKYGKLPPNVEGGKYSVWSGYRNVGTSDVMNCPKGTVVVVARGVGGTGDVKIAKEDCYLTNLSIAVNIDPTLCNPYYFYYKYFLKNLKYLDSGSAQSQITIDDLKRLQLKLPLLECQNRIVSTLKSLDDKIEINRRINENLEQQAQALFKSWFVDFEPFRNQPFVESELGMIPEGWRVGRYDDIIETTISGDWGKEKQEGNYTHKVACVRGCDFQDIKNGLRGRTPERYIIEKNFQAKHFKDKDLLVEISGGTATVSTGRVCPISQLLIDKYNQDIVCTNFCKLVRPKSSYGAYLYYSWLFKYNSKVMFGYENGTSGIKNFRIKDFTSIEPVVIPTESSLQPFQAMVDKLQMKMQLNGAESQKLAELRDTLLPRLMSGELKVNEIEQ